MASSKITLTKCVINSCHSNNKMISKLIQQEMAALPLPMNIMTPSLSHVQESPFHLGICIYTSRHITPWLSSIQHHSMVNVSTPFLSQIGCMLYMVTPCAMIVKRKTSAECIDLFYLLYAEFKCICAFIGLYSVCKLHVFRAFRKSWCT